MEGCHPSSHRRGVSPATVILAQLSCLGVMEELNLCSQHLTDTPGVLFNSCYSQWPLFVLLSGLYY